jgi:hypothetical protein
MARRRTAILAFLAALTLLLSLGVVVRAAPPNHQVCTDANCTIIQSDPGDKEAACIQTGPGPLTCSITQTGPGKKVARCIQRSEEPNAIQTCKITQTSASDDNRAEVVQSIKQRTCQPPLSPITCQQRGRQTSSIEQHSKSGDNFADSNQKGSQRIGRQEDKDDQDKDDQDKDDQDKDDDAKVSFMSETQTASQVSLICQNAVAFPSIFFPQCDVADSPLPSGRNFARLRQHEKQFAATDATATPQSNVHQTVRHRETGHIDQFSTGVPKAIAHQSARQKLVAPPGTTQVFDPDEFCCSDQGNNTKAKFDIDQLSDQQGNPDATQTARIGGNCDTSGNCDVNQKITQNRNTQNNHQSGKSVHTGFNCSSFTVPRCIPNGGSPGEGAP